MKIYVIVTMSLFIISCKAKHSPGNTNGDTAISNSSTFGQQDNLTMKISKVTFDSLVSVYSAKVAKGDSLITDDYITMARIMNTIQHHSLNSPEYNQFRKLYYPNVLLKTIKVIEALPWKGESYYSKKYDIFLSGPPHKNSEYSFL